ncbi:secreted RxLR effector peptide protein, putative [Phytophthora infestans T30-4]
MMTITVSQTLRGRVLVLLFAVVLVLETVATASDSKRVSVDLSNFARPQSDKQEIDARLLTSHDQGDKHEEEERMDTVKISQLIGGRQTAGEAFKLLKLDDGMEKLLSNPNFRTFMGFIDDYNVQNPGNGATVIKSVTATYGDDVAAAVLQRATKVSATKVTAEKLLGDLRVLWLTDKRSPLDVFKLLKLDDVATNPLDNAALDAWESYLNLFNYVNRESG